MGFAVGAGAAGFGGVVGLAHMNFDGVSLEAWNASVERCAYELGPVAMPNSTTLPEACVTLNNESSYQPIPPHPYPVRDANGKTIGHRLVYDLPTGPQLIAQNLVSIPDRNSETLKLAGVIGGILTISVATISEITAKQNARRLQAGREVLQRLKFPDVVHY